MSVKLLYNHIVFYISDLPIRGRSTFLFLPANKVAECIFLEAGPAATPLLRYMPPRGLGHPLGPGQCSQYLTMLPILDVSSYSSPMIVLVFIIPIVYSIYSPTLPSPFFLSPFAQGNHDLTVLAVSNSTFEARFCVTGQMQSAGVPTSWPRKSMTWFGTGLHFFTKWRC